MPKQPNKSRRAYWIKLLSVMALILIGVFGLYRYVAHRALELKIQAVRDAGYPIEMAELNDWYTAPEVNAAETYLRAFAAFPPDYELEAYNDLPEVGTPKVQFVLGEPLDPETARRIQDYLALHVDALELLEEAALIKACRYPGEYREGIANVLPPIHHLRRSARVLKLQSILDHDRGDHDLATQRCTSIIAVARSLENDPTIISTLVSTSIQHLAYEQIELLVASGKVSDAQLQALADAIEPIDIDRMILRAFIGERCFVHSSFNHTESLTGAFSSNPTIGQLAVVFWRASGLLDIEHNSAIDVMQARVDFAENPTWPAPAILEDVSNHVPRFCVVTRFITGWLSYVHTQRTESRRRAILAGIAVERYRQNHGRFPVQLTDLTPKFIKIVPLDPFDGQPLRYHTESAGAIIYSLGEDLTDDAGRRYSDNGDEYKDGTDIPFTFGGLQELLWPIPEEDDGFWGDPYGGSHGGYGNPYGGARLIEEPDEEETNGELRVDTGEVESDSETPAPTE